MTDALQVRYSFTAQFLRGSAIFATHAHQIETVADPVSEELQAEHRSYVVGAVIQCAAALEAEVSEILEHGPGHHLGSNGLDAAARDFLQPLADVIDSRPTLQRYELVLHLLRKPALDPGRAPYQAVNLLIKLRNELIHYHSKWGTAMDREKFFKSLRHLRLDKAPFTSPHSNFFPHKFLSASLASWSVNSTVAFINNFYTVLGIDSPLKAHAPYLVVPPARIVSDH
jgi:hypothetical protein